MKTILFILAWTVTWLGFENVELKEIRFYPAGTYREPEKTVLDNIDDFYLISMTQKVSKNHTGTFRVYLPVKWNHRFMGIAGAGSNNEVDWFTSVTFNVISWPTNSAFVIPSTCLFCFFKSCVGNISLSFFNDAVILYSS